MAALSDEIFFSTLPELNKRLRAGEFTARELVHASCERMETLGPRYNALALSLRESAVRKAADIDRELKRERFRSVFQGVPFGAKDLLAARGGPTTWGAKPYAGQVFDEDASVILRLAKAGGVLVAKLAMVELAGGGGYRFAAASLTGPGLNPWDRTRWAGGSSSGSGAAVAAGLVPYALGSETSGSILTPAAYCGVTGLRPTYGMVSRTGAMPLSWTLDKIGPLAHSAEDCGLILQAISGGDDGKAFYYAPQFVRPLKEIRASVLTADFETLAVEPLRPVLQTALGVLREAGLATQQTTLPDFPYSVLVNTIVLAESSSVFADLIESGKVDELADAAQIAGLKTASDITAKDYLRAMRIRSDIQQSFRALFAEVDVLIAPTRYDIANKISDRIDGGPRGSLIPAGNLAGLPALSLPCGFVQDLPVGICLVGRPHSENTLLAIGTEFQRRTDWHRRRPKV
jgi:aspartyl-tRNA(Asn)/glutamyl-tRNA(Gln) amidotransferase subunit A